MPTDTPKSSWFSNLTSPLSPLYRKGKGKDVERDTLFSVGSEGESSSSSSSSLSTLTGGYSDVRKRVIHNTPEQSNYDNVAVNFMDLDDNSNVWTEVFISKSEKLIVETINSIAKDTVESLSDSESVISSDIDNGNISLAIIY